MSTKLYLYPGWLRIWHFINAILCLALIITGLNMQYSDPNTAFISFATAVKVHNISGTIFVFNYVLFFIGNIVTVNGKFYWREWKGFFQQMMAQAKYYLFGTFKGEHTPFPVNENRKFNPLQKIAYVAIMYFFLPLVLLSGVAMMYPEIIIPELSGMSGMWLTNLAHIISGFIISIFLLVHLYFCTFGTTATSNFKSMVTGYHE